MIDYPLLFFKNTMSGIISEGIEMGGGKEAICSTPKLPKEHNQPAGF